MKKLFLVSVLLGLLAGVGSAIAKTENTFEHIFPRDKITESGAEIFCSLDAVVCEDEELSEILPAVITKEVVIAEIMAQARIAGINEATALRIAKCESGFNHLARNPNSTAKGVYQFLNSTWAKNCEGDVLNYKDNIACFVKYYRKYPSWWICR